MASKPIDKVRYEVITQKADDGTEDVLLPIPIPLLEKLGWKEGDKIEFSKDEHGRYVLRRNE